MPDMARLLLRAGRAIEVECQGHAWWPSPAHRERILLEGFGPAGPRDRVRSGDLLFISDEQGLGDLVRLVGPIAPSAMSAEVALDADPASRRRIPLSSIIARAEGSRSPVSILLARLH
ncbi:MAG: hypothetical protein ACRD1Z_14055, partial [Vicinamibacteria bacterium]